MYFASAEEQRYVQRALLPASRRHRVAEELRGWNWYQPPLQPIYAQRLDVSEVASRVCPSSRELYLRRVAGITPPTSAALVADGFLRATVARALVEGKRLLYQYGNACLPRLAELGQQPPGAPDTGALTPEGRRHLEVEMAALHAFEMRRVMERVEVALARFPWLGCDGLALLALPVSVDVRLDGRFLGLSEQVCIDALSLPEAQVQHLRFDAKEEWHRLMTTGQALVLESLYEAPVDVGCVVYARLVEGRVTVERDFHLIDDELRQMFIEERDDRMRLVASEVDPGLPAECPPVCPYLATCHRAAAIPETSGASARAGMGAGVSPMVP